MAEDRQPRRPEHPGRHLVAPFRRFGSALRLAPPEAKSWLDLGSGGGFPGLVLAILLAGGEGAKITLVESDTRKAAFLGEVARKTGVPVEIIPSESKNSRLRLGLSMT